MQLRPHPLAHNLWFSLLASCALSACSGELLSPLGSAAPCDDCESDEDGIRGAVDEEPSDPNRPIGVGEPDSPDGVGWSTRFPRLSNEQWQQTVNDLFYLPSLTEGLTQELPPLSGGEGYSTQAAAELTVAGDAWARYQAAAEEVVTKLMTIPDVLTKLSPADASGTGDQRATTFIKSFGRRAYRRHLSDAEVAAYLALFKQGPELAAGDAHQAGMRLVFEAMLQSPHFLYRIESSAVADDESDRKAWLSGDEIATRLSYALWGSMPSDALFAAADADELKTAEGVADWARRMLADERAAATLLSFHEQTFSVPNYGTQDKDPELGVDMSVLAPMLKDEARRFFEHVVVDGKGGITQLLTEPVAFVNAQTAPLYGITGITGDALQKVELDPAERAGLLTQVGFLSKNATRKTSDPVHRGLVVVRQILCDEPDPPPMMFELPTAEAGLTTREVYEKATACGVGCHDTLINPPGFAFETFDALGRFRTEDAGKPINAKAEMTIREGYTSAAKKANPTSTITFDGPVELLNKLADLPRVHECYARNWGAYVLAREVDPVERGAFRALRDNSLDQSATRELLVQLVKLDTFRARVSE